MSSLNIRSASPMSLPSGYLSRGEITFFYLETHQRVIFAWVAPSSDK